jgi:hypothetical protein|tara:strand:+ start:36 stop:410 length:375 start_codon:yes stop_codon:yes gene_type:complete
MPKEEKFDNYISELISTEELTELLKYIKKLAPGDQRLNFTVEDSGDGLVEGDGDTWLEVSRTDSSKICYMLLDDDGESELDFYDMTVPGLADCLYSLCGQQDEVDVKEFFKSVHELLKEFKEGK